MYHIPLVILAQRHIHARGPRAAGMTAPCARRLGTSWYIYSFPVSYTVHHHGEPDPRAKESVGDISSKEACTGQTNLLVNVWPSIDL